MPVHNRLGRSTLTVMFALMGLRPSRTLPSRVGLELFAGEAPERHIRGTASTKEVEALREEGIEVVALPVPPHRMSRTH